MSPGDFLRALPEQITPRLPEELGQLHSRQHWSLLKLWFGADHRIHYEVGFHRRIGLLEVGLHFESDPASNARLLDFFLEHLIVPKLEVSERIEAEQWDRGWSRVYEMLPLVPLNAGHVDLVSDRVVRLISCLQPLLEEATAR